MLGRSVFDPLSPQAHAISNLFIFTSIIALAIIVLIVAVLTYTTIRFRQRPGQGDPRQTFGLSWLEIIWTVIPVLIVTIVFGATISTMKDSSPGQLSPGRRPIALTVIGHQWWWEGRYSSGVVTANEIHVPVGRRLVVALKSPDDDVIHSLWVPQCGPKMDAVPGQTNYVWLECDRAGVYDGDCAEFCGAGHAWMLVRVIAEPASTFDAWQRHQRRPAPPLKQLRPARPFSVGDVATGQRLFRHYTCQSCHVITGGATHTPPGPTSVRVGPNLTHMGSRQIIAAGRISNTVANMERWLANPGQLKPGVHMPNFQLSGPEVRALTAYLESLQ